MTTKTPRRGPVGQAAVTTRAGKRGAHSFARVVAGTVALAKANAGKKKGKVKTARGAAETKPSAAAPKGKHCTPGTTIGKGVGAGSFAHLRPTGIAAPTPATKRQHAATFSDMLASARAKLGRETANGGMTEPTTAATPGSRSGGLLETLRAAKRKLGRK